MRFTGRVGFTVFTALRRRRHHQPVCLSALSVCLSVSPLSLLSHWTDDDNDEDYDGGGCGGGGVRIQCW